MAEESKSDDIATSFPKSKINILLMEKISQRAVDYFVEQGFHVETADKFTIEELQKKLPEIHVIGVRSKTKLRKDLLTKYAKKLLGWNPSRSLEEMCSDGWNWKIKNPEGYSI